MKYRTLGQGLEVSAIGIGCMPMVRGGNITYGPEASDTESIATIHRAIASASLSSTPPRSTVRSRTRNCSAGP
jgi:hypothetical protein